MNEIQRREIEKLLMDLEGVREELEQIHRALVNAAKIVLKQRR